MKNKCFPMIMLFVMIFFSNETMMFGTNNNTNMIILHYIMIIFSLLILIFLIIRKKTINKKSMIFYIIYIILISISIITNQEKIFKSLYEIFIITISLLYLNIYKKENFANNYLKIITILCKLSWIPYLLNIFMPNVLNNFPIIVNNSYYRFHNLLIGVAPFNENYHNIYRNYSIFREPGVFAVYILLGIIISLFNNKKSINYKDIIILTLTMLSTFSTAGIITTTLVYLLFIIVGKFNNKKFMKNLIVVVCFIFIMFLTPIPNQVISKISNKNNPSTISRFNSIKTNLIIFSEHPIIGIGWNNIDDRFQEISELNLGSSIKYGEKSYHNTNTLFRLLSTHGIIYFSIYLYCLILFFSNISDNKYANYMLCLIFIIVLSNENFTLNWLIYFVAFDGLMKSQLSKENIKNDKDC